MFWPFRRERTPTQLQARQKEIDKHLSLLDARLKVLRLSDADVAKMTDAHRANVDTEEAQTLRRERGDLVTERTRIQRLLADPTEEEKRNADLVHKRNEAFLDHREAETRKLIERHIETFRAQGDHHQASAWRGHLIGLRERIARDELGIGR